MIVIGYPTTAAIMDAYERNMERRWEQMNAPDPAESQMKEAADCLEVALDKIDDGFDWIADAVSKLGDYPMADKVQSFLNDFEELANQLETLKEHYERGKEDEMPVYLLPDDCKKDRNAGDDGRPVPQVEKRAGEPEKPSGCVHGNGVFPADISGKVKTP